MSKQFVNVECQECHFKRISVGLSNDKFTDNKGYQVIIHLIRHPEHVVRIIGKSVYKDYRLDNENLTEVIEAKS